MRYRDDPILKAKAGMQPEQQTQQGAKRRRYTLPLVLENPWTKRQTDTGPSAGGVLLVLGLVVLVIILSIAAYLLLTHWLW